ncbi:MAG: hypothetical protein KBG30_09545 [Bacteroidales bacterium]|nr:hypothetical protein [Bacteroidales bacterium]
MSISYWKNFTENICYTEVIYVEADIPEIPVCPPVSALSVTDNGDNTVSLEWTNPEANELPNGCSHFNFEFYDGSVKIGESNENNLTSWTSGKLSNWEHTLKVRIRYFDNNNNIICFADTHETIWLYDGISCEPVYGLSATVNEDNTVKLEWTNPQQEDLPEGCFYFTFDFYDNITKLAIVITLL